VAVRIAAQEERLVVGEVRVFPGKNTETGIVNATDRDAADRLLASDLAERIPHGGLTTRTLRRPFLERALETACPSLA
jgi:hypothetical protein